MNPITLFQEIFFPQNGLGGHHILPDVLTILFFAIVVVLLFKKLKLSPVIGYIAAGAIIGPFGLDLAGYNDVTKSLAEFGVVFLLFMIGLELTLERLFAMKNLIFGLGSLQFFITTLAFGLAAYGVTDNLSLAVVVGAGLALSSTAIVLKVLAETHQANTKTGKISLAILLLQDLAVVPLFVLIPLLGETSVDIFGTSIIIIIKSLIALAIIILAGRYLLKPALHLIASQKHDDLFIAATLFVVLSAAWMTNYMGLSLAFGAFIAGVMIAETEFQHQVKSTIDPFKGLFLGFFFITEIGMHFDLTLVFDKFFFIIFMALALILAKAFITLSVCLLFRNKFSISINTALLISQTGEFAFVLFEMARKQNIMTDEVFQNLSIIVGLSMAITPLLAGLGQRLEDIFSFKNKSVHGKNHIPLLHNLVIISGFGRVGRTIARILEKEKVRYIAIDADNNIVAKYFSKDTPLYYGDMTDLKFLQTLPLEHSAAVILTMSNTKSLKNTIKSLKKFSPNTQLIVRALDMQHYEQIDKLQAKQLIIPEVQETGLQMSKKVLAFMGESEENIHQTIEEYREKEFKH